MFEDADKIEYLENQNKLLIKSLKIILFKHIIPKYVY